MRVKNCKGGLILLAPFCATMLSSGAFLVLTEEGPLKKLLLVVALVCLAPNCFAQLSQDQAAVAPSGQSRGYFWLMTMEHCSQNFARTGREV